MTRPTQPHPPLPTRESGAEYEKMRMTPLALSPLESQANTMSCWRHPRTRDGRIALLVHLPSGVIDMGNGVSASVVGRDTIDLAISWPRVMRDPMSMMSAILSFCTDLNVNDGTLLTLRRFSKLRGGGHHFALPNQVAVPSETGLRRRHHYFWGEHGCALMSTIVCAEQPLFHAWFLGCHSSSEIHQWQYKNRMR